jgi:hypothetical protein
MAAGPPGERPMIAYEIKLTSSSNGTAPTSRRMMNELNG